MRRFIVTMVLATQAMLCMSQHAGFKPLADMPAFRERFSVAARKTNSIKSDFVQEKNLSMLSEKITSKGKFWFKKDNLVRMEYSQPFQYLMIINKNNVLIRDGQKENRVSTKSNKLFQQINKITVDCVQGTALDNPDFATKVFENSQSYLVELTPVGKNLKGFFQTINVVVDKKDYSVNSIEMVEKGGDNTVIRFINKELNPTIPDAVFALN